MKHLPPAGYVTAEDSRKPGYLAKKFAAIESKNQHIRREADARNAQNMAEAAKRVTELKPRKVKV